MQIGKVKWFSDHKGYGFIETPDSHTDVFVHFSDIEMEGYKSLRPDMVVTFEMRKGPRGPSAHRVSRVIFDASQRGRAAEKAQHVG